jgi:predicted branched-subunit amino acid permease
MAAGAPMWVVWATAFCVNLRFVVFSAQWRPYFAPYPRAMRARLAFFSGDLNYVLFMRRFPEPKPAPEQIPYFWGGALANCVTWQGASIAGIFLADTMPTNWGIGFAGTLALLGLAGSMLGDRASRVSAGVAACAAVAAYALPLRLNILVAIAAAVAAGLLMDRSRPGPALPSGGAR